MFRLLGMLLVAALVSALLVGACVSACGVAVVSVVAEEGPNFVAPVPLMLPLAALRFVPEDLMDEAAHEEMDELEGPAIVALGAFARALEDAEDAVLVRVTEDEEQVLIAKEGDELVVRVAEGGDAGTRVLVRTPLEVLKSFSDACEPAGESGVRCHPVRMAESLLAAIRGAEIEVRDHDIKVDVTVW